MNSLSAYGPPFVLLPQALQMLEWMFLWPQGLDANQDPVTAFKEIPALRVRPSADLPHSFCRCCLCTSGVLGPVWELVTALRTETRSCPQEPALRWTDHSLEMNSLPGVELQLN